MESDDVMPNDGTYFMPREPQEQVIDRKRERAQALKDEDQIKKVIGHLEERIAYRNQLDSLTLDYNRSPELHLRACVVNDMLTAALKEERDLLVDLLSTYGKTKGTPK